MITTCLGFEENPVMINLAVHSLLSRSPYHRNWEEEDYERCIAPPLHLQQFLIVWKNNKPIALVTWAFPEEQHIFTYKMLNMFPADGFYGEGPDPWIIDFICLSGKEDVLFTFKELKRYFMYLGYDRCFGLRTETGRVGKHILNG